MRKFYSVVVLFGLVLANLPSLSAQNNTARLTGTIIDSSGGAVVAAEVSVTNMETGIKWVTSSNDSGIYQIPLLQPGTYRVVVRKEGFKASSRSAVKLDIEQIARVDFVLEVVNRNRKHQRRCRGGSTRSLTLVARTPAEGFAVIGAKVGCRILMTSTGCLKVQIPLMYHRRAHAQL